MPEEARLKPGCRPWGSCRCDSAAKSPGLLMRMKYSWLNVAYRRYMKKVAQKKKKKVDLTLISGMVNTGP